MQVKELAVGDWVQNPLGYKAVILDIRRYDDGRDAFHYVVKIGEDSNNEQRLAVEELLPIPLTPEILEKNGFRVDGSGTNSRCLLSPLDEQGIRFNMYVGLKYKTIDVFAAHPEERTRGWRKSNKVYLEICGPYVHELQHALRLCGIEKEIVL